LIFADLLQLQLHFWSFAIFLSQFYGLRGVEKPSAHAQGVGLWE